MPPFLWALLVAPLWHFLVVASTAPLVRSGIPAALLECLALLVATAAVVGLDRRIMPPEWPAPGWGLRRPGLLLPALLAGAGLAILGSELNNILLARMDPEPAGVPAIQMTPSEPWMSALLWLGVQPLTLVAVFQGVVLRALAPTVRLRTALLVSALATCFALSANLAVWPPLLLTGIVAGWTYARSGSLWLAWAVCLPLHGAPLLSLLGVGPGVVGFDVPPPETGPIPMQPIWFDLLGAALAAVGVGLLIRALERPASPVAQTPTGR